MIANDIIKAALRAVLIKSGSFTPSTQQYADGLEVLNDGLNMWSAEGYTYEDTVESLTIPVSTQSITIGATGTLVTGRPLEVNRVTLIEDNQEYPLSEMDERSYAGNDKTITGRPCRYYYRNTFPDGTLYFDYTTDEEYTIRLTSIKNLTEFVDGTTDNPLPPHFQTALTHNMKIWLADDNGRQPTQTMVELARESKKAIWGLALDLATSNIEVGRRRSGFNTQQDHNR